MDIISRRAKLVEQLKGRGAVAFVSERAVDILYFTNSPDRRGMLIMRADGQHLLVLPAAAALEAQAHVEGIAVHPVLLGKTLHTNLQTLIPDGKVILGEVSHTTRLAFSNAPQRWTLIDDSQLPLSIQRQKSEDEVEKICQAVRIAEEGVGAAFGLARAGVSELEMAAEATGRMMLQGSEALWFATHVTSGERSVFPDAAPSRRRMAKGEMGFIDVGPLYDGYAGDLTRSFVLGKPSSAQLNLLETTVQAQQIALSTIKAGVEAKDIYFMVYNFFAKHELSDCFPHHAGHGLGLLGACSPFLRPDSCERLETGDILTIEPGLYVPGIGGCRIEDVIQVTKDGYQAISSLDLPWRLENH